MHVESEMCVMCLQITPTYRYLRHTTQEISRCCVEVFMLTLFLKLFCTKCVFRVLLAMINQTQWIIWDVLCADSTIIMRQSCTLCRSCKTTVQTFLEPNKGADPISNQYWELINTPLFRIWTIIWNILIILLLFSWQILQIT